MSFQPDEQAVDGRAYLRLVAYGAAIGIPAALAAALFLALVHDLEHWLWHDLPDALGHSSPPWYLVIGLPVVGAAIVAVSRRYLPGDGGHSPLEGLETDPTPVSHGPGSRSRPSARSPSVRCSGPRRPSSPSARSSG